MELALREDDAVAEGWWGRDGEGVRVGRAVPEAEGLEEAVELREGAAKSVADAEGVAL